MAYKHLEIMTNTGFGQVKVINQGNKPPPVVAASLTTPVKPLKQNTFNVLQVVIQAFIVASDTVIIPVPLQLLVQFGK